MMNIKHKPNSRAHFSGLALVTGVLLAGALSDVILARPGGETVVRGNVTFERNGNRTIIRASDGSIINYLNFNIGRDESVRFIQPGVLARVLNRINGSEPTVIEGRLLSNGQVYLVNPAGVMFGHDAVVNVGGIWAGAGNLSDADFINGRNAFTDLSGNVTNHGLIVGKNIHLAGENVANHGTLMSPGNGSRGVITMIAGDDVVIRQHGEKVAVSVDGKMLTNRARPHDGQTTPDMTANPGVENTGTVRASHGTVVLGAGDMYSLAVRNRGQVVAPKGEITVAATDGLINNEAGGVISASTLRGRAGEVTVQAPSALNEGTVSADANHGKAGYVEVTSDDHTYLTDGSRVSAQGGNGNGTGGELLVHSWNGETVVAEGAVVDVSGGTTGGQGGFAEVSGERLVFNGYADLRAKNRDHRGTLLLDPNNITIADNGSDDGFLDDAVINFGEPNAVDNLTISDEALEAIVGDIILQAFGDINVNQQVNLVNSNNVTLEAYNNVNLNQSIDGANNLTLTGDWESNGNGNVHLNAPIHVAGDFTTNSERAFILTDSITAGGNVDFLSRVNVGADTTITAEQVHFHTSVDDHIPGENFLIVNGPNVFDAQAIFDGPVGQRRKIEFLRVNGTSDINGGYVRTKDFQEYNGPATLGADALLISTDAGKIHFVETLDGPHHLDVQTAGVTRFTGDVGFIQPLLSITTDAPGRTHLEGDKIVGILDYNDRVSLGDDVILNATTSVDFAQTIDGRTNDLVINSPSTTLHGDATDLGLLQTDADGRTFIEADITGRSLDFNDPVSLLSDSTLTGRDAVDFDQTLDGTHDLIVNSDRQVRFGGDVGMEQILQSITTNVAAPGVITENLVLIDGNNIRAIDNIDFNPAGRATPAEVATVAARNFGGIRIVSQNGRIYMGENEKITSLGDLKLLARNGLLTLGDANAFGNVLADSPEIFLRAREGGRVLRYDGTYVTDSAASYVVFGNVKVTSQPELIGDGATPVFAARILGTIDGPLASFIKQKFAELSEQNFTFGGTVLDLAPPSTIVPPPPPPVDPPNPVNLATAVGDGPTRIKDFVPRDPFADRAMERLSVYMRNLNAEELLGSTSGRELYDDQPVDPKASPAEMRIATNRLRRDSVLRALDRHTAMFVKPTTDASGVATTEDQSPYIKASLARAWQKYQEQAPQADPRGLRDYLAAQPDQTEALTYLDGLRGLFKELHTMGATKLELRHSLNGVLPAITPDGLPQQELEQALEIDRLG